MATTILGFLLMLAGAVCGGSFGLPSKYVRKDTPWEVLWGPFFLFVTILIPTTVGPLIVRDFFGVFGRAGWAALALPLVFGMLWGLGSMTLGMSFSFVGLSLAYALNYGAQIATGSIVPMLLHHAERVATAQGAMILGGVGVCLLGVVVCGRAAMLRQRSMPGATAQAGAGSAARSPRMLVGVLIAILSGVLCACYAVSASFAGAVGKAATDLGNQPWQSSWAVMAAIVWGGAITSCLYCAVLLTKNRTWGRVAGPGAGRTLLLAAAMAVLHDGAIFLFGLGFDKLGSLGISVGYAVFMSFAIIVGNVHGFRAGEWRGASKRSTSWIVAGIGVLVAGVCVLGVANAMSAG